MRQCNDCLGYYRGCVCIWDSWEVCLPDVVGCHLGRKGGGRGRERAKWKTEWLPCQIVAHHSEAGSRVNFGGTLPALCLSASVTPGSTASQAHHLPFFDTMLAIAEWVRWPTQLYVLSAPVFFCLTSCCGNRWGHSSTEKFRTDRSVIYPQASLCSAYFLGSLTIGKLDCVSFFLFFLYWLSYHTSGYLQKQALHYGIGSESSYQGKKWLHSEALNVNKVHGSHSALADRFEDYLWISHQFDHYTKQTKVKAPGLELSTCSTHQPHPPGQPSCIHARHWKVHLPRIVVGCVRHLGNGASGKHHVT